MPPVSARDDQLQLERARAPIAAAGAMLAAILPMAGAIIGARTLADQPKNSASKLLYFNQHSGDLIVYAILLSLGALALIAPMVYLYKATKFRRPQIPRAALICVIGGCALLAVVQVGSQILLADHAKTFASTGDQTYEEAKRVFALPELKVLAGAGLAAQLALGFAFVMISLNAMRAGLLTRFMGFLGIIVGALFVLPLAPGPPVVQSFWLAALAALILGKWPSGVPPAWAAGREIRWPTRQEMIEKAAKERERREGGVAEPETATAAAPAPAGGRTRADAARKRKRKKRR
jgi:hypothetical protein